MPPDMLLMIFLAAARGLLTAIGLQAIVREKIGICFSCLQWRLEYGTGQAQTRNRCKLYWPRSNYGQGYICFEPKLEGEFKTVQRWRLRGFSLTYPLHGLALLEISVMPGGDICTHYMTRRTKLGSD
jgi:hypothetical protein